MKAILRQSDKKAAFTIVEILTVMSIIVILISLLVPSLTMVKRYARRVKQQAQFHSIEAAMELFHNEFDGYPDSDENSERTPAEEAYCGAMKLCEAMLGQDLLGFHPNSRFRSDCTNGAGTDLYSTPTNGLDPIPQENLRARKGPYLQLEKANAYRLWNVYGETNTGPFGKDLFVLCDVYARVKNKETGKRIGMPILYYKADASGTIHDANTPTDPKNIYDYRDNDKLVKLGKPWMLPPNDYHTMASDRNPKNFYEITRDKKISIRLGRPYRVDSYILISAGFDGEYGTEDDVFNFEK